MIQLEVVGMKEAIQRFSRQKAPSQPEVEVQRVRRSRATLRSNPIRLDRSLGSRKRHGAEVSSPLKLTSEWWTMPKDAPLSVV